MTATYHAAKRCDGCEDVRPTIGFDIPPNGLHIEDCHLEGGLDLQITNDRRNAINTNSW
jgi:hypothetical protein